MYINMRRPYQGSRDSYSFYPFHETIIKNGSTFMKVGIRYHFHPSRKLNDSFVQGFIKDKIKQGYRLHGTMNYREGRFEDYVVELVKEIVPIREWVIRTAH